MSPHVLTNPCEARGTERQTAAPGNLNLDWMRESRCPAASFSACSIPAAPRKVTGCRSPDAGQSSAERPTPLVDIADFDYRHDIVCPVCSAHALERIRPLVRDGLVRVDRKCTAATSRGRRLLGIIAMCFDRYLQSCQADAAARLSRIK